MATAFRQLEKPSIFVACPGDVRYIRDAVRDEFARLTRENGNPRDVGQYSYEISEVARTPMRATRAVRRHFTSRREAAVYLP
jgi:hypothetical protein